MKTIIFINTNKSGSSREAIRAAENLGYYTVLFTNNEKQIQQRTSYPDVHKMILVDTSNRIEMKKAVHKLKALSFEIALIVSFVDSYVYIASVLCDEFCQNYTLSNALKVMEDKEETRQVFNKYPFTINYLSIKPNDSILHENMKFPIIIKSPKSAGSKDVLLASNKKELEKHVSYLRSRNPKENVILEEYITGPQFLIEVVIHNSTPNIIAFIEQEITKGKRFIITGYSVLAEVPEKYKAGIEEILQTIVSELKIQNGAMHLEIRHTKSGLKLIEINPRISGGAMNRMIQAAYGFNLVEETLKLYLGEQPNIKAKYKYFVFTKYIVLKRKGVLVKVTGRNRASEGKGVVEVYIKPRKGTLLIPPLSMGHRYAYIIAKGNTKIEARKNALKAAKEIQFHLKAQ
ncbi:ATP-grasp domain-containing protein [Lysinibacillus sp. 54212]|uniref:ATP-grasp domain-containing protein n=1 Tax=Lysinibacillus sp. 54212 TaxID=3119829 RepID=UPI003FA55C42